MFNGHKWYVVRSAGRRGKYAYMHREIMGVTDPEILVDHRDGDGLNNQDDNLRICNDAQNGHNRGKQKRNTSGYKGVTWNKNKGKYQAQIMVNRRYRYLGLFDDPADGARAYDRAARELQGSFAWLNFPEEHETGGWL
jgi:hypothetical protein